ncbi:MAG TPA: ATP-binding cassette domain-containing protein [Acidimicrobiales bacterium]|nr:ATP-binding cassette domain-containing protein [Acidimicrobiales bacterium]
MTEAVSYRDVQFAYPREERLLDGVRLDVHAGEVLLFMGRSGSGKSTVLRCVNGLVPHSTGGSFGGDVVVGGRSTRSYPPRKMADVVGFVHQDPEAQFVVDQVEADVAFALENLGMSPPAMRRRVEEVLDALGIAHLRDRSPASLSGGERQRAAIAGALAAGPSVLVLDEPTSQLDPQGADDVLAAIGRLNADLGTTVLLAEHRLERAAPLADRAVVVDAGAVSAPVPTAEAIAGYEGAPSVTRLGRLLGWHPAPLTVREAQRFGAPTGLERPPPATSPAPGAPLVAVRGASVELGRHRALRAVDVSVAEGEVIAVFGRNGAGKTTLLRAVAGLVSLAAGVVTIAEGRRAAYVPQDPNTLLLGPTVRDDVETTCRLLGQPAAEAADRWLAMVGLTGMASRHPRDLSAGERQRVAIAAVGVGEPDVLLLDEPTRGMDAPSKAALEVLIRGMAGAGRSVMLATHDVELAARVATRVVVLGDGEVVADGPARDVLAGSLFAPQVLRVLPPFLTVEEVAEAIGRA